MVGCNKALQVCVEVTYCLPRSNKAWSSITSLGNVLDGFKKLYISVLVCILSHAMVGCDHRCVRGVCIASVGCLHLSEPSHQKTEGCVEAANGVLPQSSQPASSSTRPQKERWHPAHGGIHSRSSHGGTALLLNCILSFPDWFGQAMNSACLDKLNTVRGFQKLTMSFSKWKIFMSGWVGWRLFRIKKISKYIREQSTISG